MDRTDRCCETCGRRFAWRRKWSHNWNEVRFCSDGCRRHRPTEFDRKLEDLILELLQRRAAGGSICPSEAARAASVDEWRPLMERVRQAARRLESRGLVEITQGGRRVDSSTARGPIRIRRADATVPVERENHAGL